AMEQFNPLLLQYKEALETFVTSIPYQNAENQPLKPLPLMPESRDKALRYVTELIQEKIDKLEMLWDSSDIMLGVLSAAVRPSHQLSKKNTDAALEQDNAALLCRTPPVPIHFPIGTKKNHQ